MANNYKVHELNADGGPIAKVLRDSAAARPYFPRQPKPKGPLGPEMKQDTAAPPARAAAAAEPGPPPTHDRGRKRAAQPAATAAEASSRKRRALSSQRALDEDRQAEKDAGRWLAELAARPRTVAAGPTASERLEAMRERIRNRNAASVAVAAG